MLEILEFIFSSFWRWVGATIMLMVITEGMGNLLRTIIIKIKKRGER